MRQEQTAMLDQLRDGEQQLRSTLQLIASATDEESDRAVKHFLVIYDRRQGRIVRKHAYRGASEALQARFEAEREFKDQQDVEVVVLGGASWPAVQRTHSRYFNRVQDLAKAGLERLAIADT